MTEEPYRWLEAVANRRDYVREQLKGGSPVFAVSLTDGILLLGVGTGQSKVFELHDRQALAGLGHPADLEKVRQAAIDAAHVESFTRAPEDVSLRRLVSFGLGPQMKTQFEQIFSPPFLLELLLAELGAAPARDTLIRLHFDGAFQLQRGGVAVVGPDPGRADAANAWLAKQEVNAKSRDEATGLLLQAWWLMRGEAVFEGAIPEEPERREGWREAVKDRQVEIGWLNRKAAGRARYESVPL